MAWEIGIALWVDKYGAVVAQWLRWHWQITVVGVSVGDERW